MLRRNPVPPHIRQGIRTALGVGIACAIGYGIVLPIEGYNIGDDIAKACKWAAITCVVVTVPVLGKVSQVSFERTLGTVIGGLLGFVAFELGDGVWNQVTDGWVLSVVTAIFAYLAVMAANRFKLDTSAKLSSITFILVTFGGDDNGPNGALVTALWRIAGIVFGVLLSLLLSVILFPKSASVSAMWELKSALDCLVKLGDICWKNQHIFRQELIQQLVATAPTSAQQAEGGQYVPLPASDLEAAAQTALRSSPSNVAEKYQAEAEKRLNDLYNALAKCKDMCGQSDNEILVGVFRGRWCFLPGSSCLRRRAWRGFQNDIENAATQVRKCSRLLWMLHINFEEGFDENMRALLKQQYPAALFPSMISYSMGVLSDLASAWPNAQTVPRHNLDMFVKAVSALTAISDYNRRRILRHMCRYNYVGRGVGTAPEQPDFKPVTQLGSVLRKMSTGVTVPPAVGTAGALNTVPQTITEDKPVADARVDWDHGSQAPDGLGPPRAREPSAGDLVQHHLDAMTPCNNEAASPTSEHTSLTFHPTSASRASSTTSSQHTVGVRLRNFTAEDEFQGDPEDAFDELEGVRIQMTPSDSAATQETAVGDRHDKSFVMQLPHTTSLKLALFPETSEGHVSQVRWYSFQFLLEELAEQFDETVLAFDALLAHIQLVEQDSDGWVWM